MMRAGKASRGERGQRLTTSLLLALLALASVSAVTVAWFSIADNTKLQSMSLDVTTGLTMRFDLDAHADINDYVKTLGFAQISQRIQRDLGFDPGERELEPVTTTDCMAFSFEDGGSVSPDSGVYLEFTLHFLALKDMMLHLTSAHDVRGGAEDGTRVWSGEERLVQAMRIGFTLGDTTIIYDPGAPGGSSTVDGVKTFGLPAAGEMVLNEDNALFFLPKEQDQPVVVHIWLEGTDEACDNRLKGWDYAIQLRFEGTDLDNNVINDQIVQ